MSRPRHASQRCGPCRGCFILQRRKDIMEIKPATTLSEQVELLKSRGIIIENDMIAEAFLYNVSYYTLSGYLHAFKVNEQYTESISVEKIMDIYKCDQRFRNTILFMLDEIEQDLKTKISYILAHNIGPLGYLDTKYFISENEHKKFLDKFKDAVHSNRNLPFVKHHIKNYDSKFPIWVAVNLFTLGTLDHFYKNLKGEYKKQIAKEYNLSTSLFSDWIHCISYLRNMVAHYMRLYNFKIQVTPKKDKYIKNFPNPTYHVFDILYIIKLLYPSPVKWNSYIMPTIEQLFVQYSENIDIQAYGFNNNWKKFLFNDYSN